MSSVHENLAARCVILVPRCAIETADHIALKFELDAIIEHHPALAMAETCLLHRESTSKQAWNSPARSIRLVIIHADKLEDTHRMVNALHKYIPNVQIEELRDGQLVPFEHGGEVVDSITEHPIVQTDSVDADELSMLLDDSAQKDIE